MAELPHLIADLALILVVAGFVILLFKKLRQPLVLGYILAGFLVSPHMPYTMSVVDKADIQTWADIGVLFLLFALGLDFSVKKILKMGLAPVIASLTIIFCMMLLGINVGHAFGWDKMDCIFLGGMLAMSSTTIIYKAFDDLGFRQQKFAGLVMSVLILEDVLAIVLMVMLSTLASGSNPDGEELFGSLFRIGYFLVLWFVVGLFVIPSFLRKTRKLMNGETLVIVALGLCCLMAVISTQVGFSSAFGAFVMGSILAETVEADKIIRVVEPIKNLFGAIFFVSVGMLVDPVVMMNYAVPIVVLVLAILIGQGVFGTFGFLLSGQSLKTAMRCGFSMAQIGEFAFIIASLGLSLGVISKFLYPVVVAVSVITTFLTPYMMRAAEPCYALIERRLPKRWLRRLDHLSAGSHATNETGTWKRLLRKQFVSTVIYGTLSAALTAMMLTFFLPFVRQLLPHWWANGVCGVLTVALISPFLRALVMRHFHSDEFKLLWTENRINRLPLLFTSLVKVIIASSFIFYICNYLTRFTDALMITIAVSVIIFMILSRSLKHRSIRLERLFIQNLQSRDIEARVQGRKRPLFEGHLLDRDIHISDVVVPEDSIWAGLSLRQLQFRNRFGVHVSSILRGRQRLNIPNGDMIIFPGDKIQVIGNDEQLHNFSAAMKGEVVPEDVEIEKREMKLRQLVIGKNSCLAGKTLKESGIRDRYNCMVVGAEQGQQALTVVNPTHVFEVGDVVWVVGEESSLQKLMELE
uniref:Cation:proton antiporter n=1 Tax=Prevotella sp. GTC17262 TaxID=3236797 RepID=A0AB33JM20_9BACT